NATHRTSGTFTGTNITVSYDSATETLTLSGYDTIANYNTVLGAVEYHSTGSDPTNGGANATRTVHWTVSDGAPNIDFGAQNSASTTFTIHVNAPPTITNLNGDSVSFTEGGSAVHLDAGTAAAVSDTDSTDFDTGNLTVSITTNKVGTEDALGIDTS